MNLQCLNDIITDNLAIHIDLTNIKSWNLNSGLTSTSLTKWSKAISDDVDLIDYGLTEFDNGKTNKMYEGITITPNDVKFKMDRVGYNQVKNPTTGETSGSTVTTKYDLYSISGITASTGNYFNLNGGYLQGFFKLSDYKYELLPARYNEGITVETILYIQPNSQGIFYMMGIRAEDKYNTYFSGETITGNTQTGLLYINGVTTSEGNTFESFNETTVNKTSFSLPENKNTTIYSESPQIDNVKSNVIAFELTEDKRLAYKYVDGDGSLIHNTSPTQISATGWTILTIAYTPDNLIPDISQIDCYPRRTGKLVMYVNGRSHWTILGFPEYSFRKILNNRNLQIGVPYSISWGGGSFGLKHSWHYDYQTYVLYNNQTDQYIKTKFVVESNPIPAMCDPYSGGTELQGLSLELDNTSFHYDDECSNILHQESVMKITYTGTTGFTGTTACTYFVKFDQPITVLSNREYTINLSLFNDEFFSTYNAQNGLSQNKVSIVVYGTTDIDIVQESQYYYPINGNDLMTYQQIGLAPFPDRQQYEYIGTNGVLYYGETGIPVGHELEYSVANMGNDNLTGNTFVTGQLAWKQLSCKFKTQDNTGKQQIYVGILIESDFGLNYMNSIYVDNFTYTGQDILVQDNNNKISIIEDNFNNSYIGRIQKLRVYDKALNSSEILHNAIIESTTNSNLNINVNKGGRIIIR